MVRLSDAIAKIEEGNVSTGLDMLKEMATKANDDLLIEIAETYVHLGLLEDALYLLDQLLQKYPDHGELRILTAECLIDLDKEDKAIQYLNRIDETDEHYLNALLLLADLYQSQGLEEVAEQKLLRASRISPDEPVISYALAEFYLSQGRVHQAIPFYEKILDEPGIDLPIESIMVNYAEALSMNGDFEKALSYYEKGLKKQPLLDHLFKYGYTALRAEQFEKAIEAFEKLRTIDPHYATLYPHLASAYEAIGALDEAMDALESGMKVDEVNDELYYFAAKLSLKLGNRDQAKTLLKKTLTLNPESTKANHMLLSILKQEKRDREVIDHILQLKDSGEDDPSFEWDLADAYHSLEEYELARNHYENAYAFFKEDAQFLAQYGHFLLEEGDHKKALKHFRKALEMEGHREDLHELVAALEEREWD